ncbi:MAG TPA: hypothetical protein VFH58_01050 [Acidimicrobiales bacterium]|nr:hypothetical protein [Acidimicrobiales bacterium]
MTATVTADADAADRPQPDSEADRRPRRLLRLRSPNLDLRNTWQIVLGSLLLPLGIAFILLAWSGAAHGRVDQQQIPYLVSGGIGGLAVVMIGCFFYWAHWLYRIYDQADLQHQEALREQREMMRALIEALASNGGRVPAAAGERAGAAAANGLTAGRTFVATAAGTNFHTPGCPMVANRSGSLRTVTEEEMQEMKPCRVCEPLVAVN